MKQSKILSCAAFLSCVILFVAQTGWTKVEFDSSQLMMKNAEQVGNIVQKKIKKAQAIQTKQEDTEDGSLEAEPEALEHLKDALRIVLARPDQDGARANIFSTVRRELSDLNSLDDVLLSLAKEAITGAKTTSLPAKRQMTYIVLLENLLAEIKPEVSSNATFKKIVESVRDADIEITEKVRQQSLLRSMSRPKSPSDSAKKILAKDSK